MPVRGQCRAPALSLAPRRPQKGTADMNSHSAVALLRTIAGLGHSEEGQDLLEYALLVALIALIAIGGVTLAGTSVNVIFTNIANALTTAA
jgi:pilus assembly protein Flp/PilA